MAAIERHDSELHAVAAEQPRAGGVVTGGGSGVMSRKLSPIQGGVGELADGRREASAVR